MIDSAAQETERILSYLEGELRDIYDAADEDIQSEIEDYLEAIYLYDDEATARQRIKYAERNGMQKVVAVFLLYMLAANEKAVKRINGTMNNVADINYSLYRRIFNRKAGLSINPYDYIYTANKYGRRAFNRLKSESYVSKNVLRQIKKDIKAGKSIPKIADGIQKVSNVSRNSAILTARTETIRIMNSSRMDAFEEARKMGIKFKKMWNHSGNVRNPRHWHQDMDGVTIELDEPFEVGGALMMQPGDPDGGPENTCNCACFVTAEDISF